MNFEVFITILVSSAAATSAAVELIKSILDGMKRHYKTVPVAIVTALVVGAAEIFIYYILNGTAISPMTVFYAICMGIANVVGATSSYDLVKKFLNALTGRAD